MKYPASEKLEIIRTGLDKVGIPKPTFYAWFDRYLAGGLDALKESPAAAQAGPEPHPR